MIIDTIDHLSMYSSILPLVEDISKLYATGSIESAPCEIRKKAYLTRQDSLRRFEVHQHTIDLMICISGQEVIHICPAEELSPSVNQPCPSGEDVLKLDGAPRGSAVLLQAGYFVAICPGEAHMVGGQVTPGEEDDLIKWVVKIPAD